VIILVFSALLWGIAAWLLAVAWRRHDGTAKAGFTEATRDFMHLLPRLAVGVIGAGYIARAMPQDLVTPGGPVVGFALGAAALKSGAGLPQVMAFVTGWSLYTINRVLVWEVPTMPMRFVIIRTIVSLPFPFLVAGVVAWLG
jgi:hypothetical protein